ncbi:hypothetical protein G3T14_04065 [Methylobacterium sp. BTF04]|uniref:hypothetical protein n=1 Tax=Methylobacterium sp. BTF04 TaxID=2708300 RepID=UPI0013D4F067|nr:hypothetical protein [Methylobacterium sp. BTF04]NEU11300.1 hypothetical protein [Methylobacterium sp. BTF04]
MLINAGRLQAIEADENDFVGFYSEYSENILHLARLFPRLSRPRIIEAHGAWTKDLERVGSHENKLYEGLDHFKRAGHLAFWLRRMSPIVEFVDETMNIADGGEYTLDESELKFRDLIAGHANEYMAFDIGFQYCKFYELSVGSKIAGTLDLSEDYIRTTCHFMKYKQCSPHSLFMVYKSLFYSVA